MGFYKEIILTYPCLQKEEKSILLFLTLSLYLLWCNQKGDYNTIKINTQQLHNVLMLGFFINLFPCAFWGL